MAEIDPKQVKETTTKISIKKKYAIELREKEKQIEKLECEISQIRANIQIDKEKQLLENKRNERESNVFSLYILSEVVTKTFGNGDLSSLTDKLFKEEELFEYKAKMLEILKRL